jgi:aminopeptidase N
MKFLICLFATIVCLEDSIYAQQPGRTIDVQRYIFEVNLNDQNDSITCIATIHFNLVKSADEISLDLISQRADGKGMKINSVTENGKLLKHTHRNDIVGIRLSAAGKQDDAKTIQIKYTGIPADGLIISKNKYNRRTFFSDHWPNRARHWLPCIDHPSDKAAVEFMVTAPLHYQVISNGVMIEETNLDASRKFTHYRENMPLPMKVAVIGVADFAVRFEGEVNSIPVESWVYPEDRIKGFHDYGMAIDMLPYFIKSIGPYAYKKLANVQSKTVFGGMENAGAIFYSESSVTGKRSAEVLMAHEIAHQWFGNMATEAEWAHVWLSEGFATYMAILYMENKYGEDTATKMRIEDRQQIIAFSRQKPRPVVDSSTTNYMDLLNANSYQKGGWVLHMLRKQLGEPVFWNCIRAYYQQYSGKNAVTDDLRKILEIISGRDLKRFFRQWLFTAGHPVLDIQWKFNMASKILTVNITQQQATAFEFPLQMNIVLEGQKIVEKSANICEKQTTISIPLASTPVRIIADPEANLLYEATIKENNR